MYNFEVCLTFDVDLVRYIQGSTPVQEMDKAVPLILQTFQKHPEWHATWFIRLDKQIDICYGSAEYLFSHYEDLLSELKGLGHEIGWHPHSYRWDDNQWIQNTAEEEIAEELIQYAPQATDLGLEVVRMGWGFHTNRTMHCLAEWGFKIDASAIPRPRYVWEETVKDWSITPIHPYHPSADDYRRPGHPELSILEFPMSVALIRAPYDTQMVLRYIDLAYHTNVFEKAISRWFGQHTRLVTIAHPYEFMPQSNNHPLLSFSIESLERNIARIQLEADDKAEFLTLSEAVHKFSQPARSNEGR